MIGAGFRHVVTALLGKVPCNMPWCGRPARAYRYCVKHIHDYKYLGGA